MARIIGELPKGCRITDHISRGVISKAFPMSKVKEVLHRTGKASQRQRDLPAHVVVYYVIALALYLQVSYREVLRCLLAGLPCLYVPGSTVHVTGQSACSPARCGRGAVPPSVGGVSKWERADNPCRRSSRWI